MRFGNTLGLILLAAVAGLLPALVLRAVKRSSFRGHLRPWAQAPS